MTSQQAATAAHEPVQLYLWADSCPHPAPPEPVFTGDDPAGLWDAWVDDHPYDSDGEERICLLTPAGTRCPACSDAAGGEDTPCLAGGGS